jgi:hypothetical protein
LFRQYAAELLSPAASTAPSLKAATEWIESIRKSAHSFDYFLRLLHCPAFLDYEYLIASQSLLWISKRSGDLQERWMEEVMLLLPPHRSSPPFAGPVCSNLYLSTAALLLRLSPFPPNQIISGFYSLNKWDDQTFLRILLCLPELCLSSELSHGTKDQINQNVLLQATSLYRQLPSVLSFIDSLICHKDGKEEQLILEFLSGSAPSPLESLLVLVTDWLTIPKHLLDTHQVPLTCECIDQIGSSRWMQLLHKAFQCLSQHQEVTLSERQIQLLQLSSEVLSCSPFSSQSHPLCSLKTGCAQSASHSLRFWGRFSILCTGHRRPAPLPDPPFSLLHSSSAGVRNFLISPGSCLSSLRHSRIEHLPRLSFP